MNLRYFILFVSIAITCQRFFIDKSIFINSAKAEDVQLLHPEASLKLEGKSFANQSKRFYVWFK
ncbi:MAG: hypothetical protein DYH15_09905 [Nitrosomonas sp. PRO4]|nr:hypothetical protein [Nitrosomonas sp. PRO4]